MSKIRIRKEVITATSFSGEVLMDLRWWEVVAPNIAKPFKFDTHAAAVEYVSEHLRRVKIRSEVDEWSGRLWRAELPTGYARWFAHFEGALRWAERMMRA